MNWIDAASLVCLASGCFFYLAGSIGMLRLPDAFSRLHAMTKADNLGLGLLVVGLSFHAASPAAVLKLVVIWMLVIVASATTCHLVARRALRSGMQPWSKP